MEIARRLRSSGKSARNISQIRIRTMKPALTIIEKSGMLQNAADRDYCLSYMVAVTLLKCALPQVEDYANSSRFATNKEVERLRRVTSAFEDPQLTRDYYDQAKRTLAAGLTAMLDRGEVLDEVLVEAPLGHARHRDTNDAVLSKFRENMALAFRPAVANDAIAALQDDQLPISRFMDLFWKGSSVAADV